MLVVVVAIAVTVPVLVRIRRMFVAVFMPFAHQKHHSDDQQYRRTDL